MPTCGRCGIAYLDSEPHQCEVPDARRHPVGSVGKRLLMIAIGMVGPMAVAILQVIVANRLRDPGAFHPNQDLVLDGLLMFAIAGGCVLFTRAFSSHRVAVAILYVPVMLAVTFFIELSISCGRYHNCL